MKKAPLNSIHPASRKEWREWLKANHARSEGVWLVNHKKGTGKPRIVYEEAVEEALCFGWIDSKPNKLDAERSLLWFAPRKSGTGWSRLNKARVERLIAAGLMAKAGLEKVQSAQRDDSWEALDSVEALKIPADLRKELASRPPARENFDGFPPSVKKGILQWIVTARRPETRAKRIKETAESAKKNIRANQWRGGARATV